MEISLLHNSLEGEVLQDSLTQNIYATDASVYQELPVAVAIPKNTTDVQKIVRYCKEHNISIIPRAAGTSLAGQCVGSGMVVDISKHFRRIWNLDVEARTVWVEPGVIRDELNAFLLQHGLHYGPNTSTANRCMMGGMAGNNSCGSSSIKFGSTRDHVLEMKAVLADGEEVLFKAMSASEVSQHNNHSLYSRIINSLWKMREDAELKRAVEANFPHQEVKRRNTGYALDSLIDGDFNPCKLLVGSEGTLAFTTALKVSLDPIPGPERAVVCPHFHSVHAAMQAIPLIMSFAPDMCELMDKVILDCTKANKKQKKNRFFLDGDPQAVLMVQFNRNTNKELEEVLSQFSKAISEKTDAYSSPTIYAPDDARVFELRAAGLGVLANLPGEPKAVACIEDTAVRIEDLADYIEEFEKLMQGFGQEAVFYAHAGAGEIHLRPILNLKKEKDVTLFYEITKATALLVKKYGGSLSGEHGDGRVRAEFIPLMVGEKMYEVFKELKKLWDPGGLFNPGKIVDAAPMTSSLRYFPEKEVPEPATIFRFDETGGMIRAAEKCNGSGDCRKLNFSGGTMCPSYQATRNEKDTTRARANALRNFLSNPADASKPFESEEIKEVLDLCLSCKACGTECPSNVDMTTLKAEFMHHYQKTKGASLRSKVFSKVDRLNKLGHKFRLVTNMLLRSVVTKRILNIAPERNLPLLNKIPFRRFALDYLANTPKQNKQVVSDDDHNKTVTRKLFLFIDEFTNYNDEDVGRKAMMLLDRLGYDIQIVDHPESGRAAFSKGFLDHARKCANKNVGIFSHLVSADTPLVGIEPSAILSFRDEYPKIVTQDLIPQAEALASHAFTIEEFLYHEIEAGRVTSNHFKTEEHFIYVHGHCHQKALSSVNYTAHILSLPTGHKVEVIPSGCCGMAGSFGYESEHYDVSMKIGEEVLFPTLRQLEEGAIIVASGTSCRHQISDGVGRKSFHPMEVLYQSLKIP